MTTDMAATIVRQRCRATDKGGSGFRSRPFFLLWTSGSGREKRKDAPLDATDQPRPHLVGMLIGWVVLLIALAGLVIYLVASNPKAQEIGRLMFGCGLLALCFVVAGKTVRLL